MKKTLFIASLALLASACASTQTAKLPATPENAAAAIAAAEAASNKAAAVGYQWRDTAKLIASAKKAESTKDSAKAIELAQLAHRQSENAIAQQAQQKDAANRF